MDIYGKAEELLCMLSTPYGIKASLSQNANYEAVFTRDAMLAGMTGLLVGIEKVCDGHIRTLEMLRQLQGKEGQIASNYTYQNDVLTRVSYGTLSPKIDAATWYIIGVCQYALRGKIDPDQWKDSVEQTMRLLDTLEYNGRHLIYIPKGGNWADEYIDEGYILYDQVLRAWSLQLAGQLYGVKEWTDKGNLLIKILRVNYWPDKEKQSDPLVYHTKLYERSIREEQTYPCSSFSPSRYSERFDLAACSLIAIADPHSPEIRHTLDWIETTFLSKGKLPPAFAPVIQEGQPGWRELSQHYLFTFKNSPYHYHNGGIWWIWLGCLALALKAGDRSDSYAKLCALCDKELASNESFEFDEYIDGKYYKPGGETMMAYSASGLLMMKIAEYPVIKESF